MWPAAQTPASLIADIRIGAWSFAFYHGGLCAQDSVQPGKGRAIQKLSLREGLVIVQPLLVLPSKNIPSFSLPLWPPPLLSTQPNLGPCQHKLH